MKNFFDNTILGVVLSFIIPISFLLLIQFNQTFSIIFFIILLGMLPIILNFYILSSLFFIIPISKKYKILADEVSSKNTSRYILCFIITLFIICCFYLLYKINCLSCIIFIGLFILETIALTQFYKKFTILDYINHYSADLFNWYKIYKLNIDNKVKEACFEIHNIDINYYKELYEEYKDFELEYIIFKSKQNTVKKIDEDPFKEFLSNL